MKSQATVMLYFLTIFLFYILKFFYVHGLPFLFMLAFIWQSGLTMNYYKWNLLIKPLDCSKVYKIINFSQHKSIFLDICTAFEDHLYIGLCGIYKNVWGTKNVIVNKCCVISLFLWLYVWQVREHIRKYKHAYVTSTYNFSLLLPVCVCVCNYVQAFLYILVQYHRLLYKIYYESIFAVHRVKMRPLNFLLFSESMYLMYVFFFRLCLLTSSWASVSNQYQLELKRTLVCMLWTDKKHLTLVIFTHDML